DGASDCTGSVLDVTGDRWPLVHNVAPSIREITAHEDYSKRCNLSLTSDPESYFDLLTGAPSWSMP
ncbi:MAG: hypothetical protein RL109_2133, partial [Pseudomonadota bacterium]